MRLHQILFYRSSRADAEQAVEIIETAEPDAFSSFSYVEESVDNWRIEAIVNAAEDTADTDGVSRMVADILGIPMDSVDVVTVPDRDWVSHSLNSLTPVRAGAFTVYGSHQKPIGANGSIGVEIDAGLAFGTGHHETTQGCLLHLSDVLKKCAPKNALDVGCGSGVLAIAFAKSVRRSCVATDIDPIAVSVARSNADQNTAAPHIRFAVADGTRHSAVAAAAPYDLIFANILAKPLKRLAIDLRGVAAPAGFIILSGMLVEQEASVLSAYRIVGFRLVARYQIGDWSSLLLSRLPN